MKRTMTVILLSIMLMTLSSSWSTQAIYQNTSSVVIHEDGSVTPSSAPITRSGDTYTLTDDIYIPDTTNEGIRIEKDDITLDGAGHNIRGHGESSSIFLENRSGVTIRNVILENFYWGIEFQNSTKCTVSNSNLTAVMYPIYLGSSSGNKFYHNNIYRIPHLTVGSDNTWDNGYPSGGNFWDGYPYPDTKRGPNQNQTGGDGIGDVAVGEEIFSQGGENVDRYPLMVKQTFEAGAITSLKIAIVDPSGKPVQGATVESTAQPSGQQPLSGTTGEDGIALFNDVKPGSYTIQASKTGFPAVTSTISTTEGTTVNLPITFQPTQLACTLKVTVTDQNGAAITGASVSSTTQPSGQETLAATTGADGVATFSDIKPGGYTLQASKNGYAQKSGSSNVADGETANLRLTLQAAGDTAGGGGVPGFPIEAMALGVILVLILLQLTRKQTWVYQPQNDQSIF